MSRGGHDSAEKTQLRLRVQEFGRVLAVGEADGASRSRSEVASLRLTTAPP